MKKTKKIPVKVAKRKHAKKKPIIFNNSEIETIEEAFDILLYDPNEDIGYLKDRALKIINDLFIKTMKRFTIQKSDPEEENIHPLIIEVTNEYGVPVQKILGRDRRSYTAYVRRTIAYRMQNRGYSINEIATFLHKSSAAIYKMLEAYKEDMKDGEKLLQTTDE